MENEILFKFKNRFCLYLKADKLSNTYELSIKYFQPEAPNLQIHGQFILIPIPDTIQGQYLILFWSCC